MITARQANGTGPYTLKSREPDVKTVLVKNPNWWGLKAGRWEGNADEVIYTPIVSDGTRVAALISGEVDLVNDPPPQDVPRLTQTPGIKVLEGTENRIVFIGMDQFRDELLYSNVKGKNPLKDKRVREALYYAVDIEAIKKNTMRGLSAPSGAMLPSTLQTTPEVEKRLPFDRERAKKLLAEAGYPNGFEVTLDCPNNRYINDEKICQALAAMWSQIGVNTKVNTMPRAVYFPKLEKNDTSMYMLGWGGGTTDATLIDASTLPLADPLVAGKLWNFGGTCRISMGTVPFTLSYGTLQTYTLTGANVRRSVPLLSGMFQGNQAQLTMLVSQSVSGTAKNVTVYLLYNGVTQAQQTIAMTVDSTAGNDRTFNITFTTSRGAAGTSYPWSVELSSSTAGGPVYSVSGSLNTLLV